MATSKGVLHGYTGLAVVDAAQPLRGATTMITADAGYHNEANLRALDTMSVEALIADRDLRKRDECFATPSRHQQGPHQLHHKTATPTTSTPAVFTTADFTYDAEARTGVCPAGKSLNRSGGNRKTKDDVGAHFRGAKRDCWPCPLRAQCLRTPDTTPVRNIAIFHGRVDTDGPTHTAGMQARVDLPEGREAYG